MQPLGKDIFRKVALERLSSPDQLDLPMRVISPMGWFAFISLLGLVVMAALWGWFGSVPTKVIGKCILINPIGLADVTSLSTGRVTRVLVHVGDAVRVGTVVARVAQPELADRIDKAELLLRELEVRARIVRSFASRSRDLSSQSLAQQRRNLENQLRAVEDHARILLQRVDTQRILLEQGLITNQQLLQTRQELSQAELSIDNIKGQIKQLALQQLETEKQTQNEIANIEGQINETRRALDSLLQSREQMATVVSPYEGRVIEVKTDIGSLVGPGSSLVTIEKASTETGGLQAVVYVPTAEGRKVRVNMHAQVTPSTVKREEYGFMVGNVTYVSDYPVTAQSMMLVLQNDALVKELMGSSPPIEMRVAFPSAENRSGYRWSSSAGPPVRVRAGTLCTTEIVVERQRPVLLVIPGLKKSLGLD